ncbi:AmmeMemoRadiSam system protein B [Isachenkonia alkalipeptolytica]|uniref:AmmeMemoRadiSam system protein B n=1 Tax=Isachenkonia alkalipeptolytica TaxID=2565777 RepID=A0AA43XJF7_9CLOT|nr:AmmeMemoRadiSam system protein B [Isachenkonia alkalipeptolytica]NBG87985.1 AmmeMemoRadiSam system protein B [Isachenkonia alkalipeptolytica]
MGQIQGMFIVPHPPILISELGKGKEKEAQRTLQGMKEVAQKIKAGNPDTLVLITPHGAVHQNKLAFLEGEETTGDLREFGYPHLKMTKELDAKNIEGLKEGFKEQGLPGVFIEESLDHGAFVPLHFIEKEIPETKLIHIAIGMLGLKELYDLGLKIQEILEAGEGAFTIVVSGDLSHRLKDEGPYGYDERGEEFDRRIINAIKRCNVADIMNMPEEIYGPAGECGLRPIVLGFGILGEGKLTSRVLSYEGPFGVGYMNAWVQKN